MPSDFLDVIAGPLVAGGDSLVRRDGDKTMFVDGALPGESVRIAVTKERKDLVNASVVEVLGAAPERIDPPCPVYKRGCGGCQWQHATVEAQHRYKVGIVQDALMRIAKMEDATVHFAGAVPEFSYRTTMRAGVDNGRIALRKRNSHELVELSTCLIAHPLLEELVVGGHYGDANEVTLRVGVSSGERLVYLHGYNTELSLPSDVFVTSSGKGTAVHENVLGHEFRVSARSFFQSGPAASELLTATVDALVDPDADWIIDAYAGIGVLGATVAAKRDCRVAAIESSKSAVADAHSNLRHLQAQVIEAQVSDVELSGMEKPDVVIADPARSGLGPSASKSIASMGAWQIVLVSCDPASLARDTLLLQNAGYTLDEVKVLDLFPQTHHVETVTTFKR